MARQTKRRPPGNREPIPVITEAEPSQAEQLRSRERRYFTMMGLRVACLIGAVAAVQYSWWLVGLCIVGMVALPWAAVLIANDRPPLRPSLYRRFTGHIGHGRALESRPHRVVEHRPEH